MYINNYSIVYLGMKVMLKLVPNHSSTSHIFFERSILKEPLFKDYYIWNPGFSNGDKHFPINNWVNIDNSFKLGNFPLSLKSSCYISIIKIMENFLE